MRIDLEGYGARYRAWVRWLMSGWLLPGSQVHLAATALRRECPMVTQ